MNGVLPLPEIAEFALAIAASAGAKILPHFRQPIAVENKDGVGGYDPVTVADRAAESVIREAITRAWPAHGLYGEEHGHQPGSEPWTWVIDPIDGTRAFILGQLHWGTLIALSDGTRPVLGVAYQPYVGEAFVAWAGGAAQWRRGNEQRILKTRRGVRHSEAVVASTSPYFFTGARESAAFRAVSEPARLTRFGGDLYCYTLLAAGLVDVAIETGLMPYDVQALIPIIEAAGGVITDWRGGTCYEGGDVLACGDPALHAELLRRIERC